MAMSDWREQEATNQIIFRDMNEWTEEARRNHRPDRPMDTYLCECSARADAESADVGRAFRNRAVQDLAFELALEVRLHGQEFGARRCLA
jgi:hypothetical protein